MKLKVTSFPLIVSLLAFLLTDSATAENPRPVFVGKSIQETQLSMPQELHEYDSVQTISVVSKTRELPFILLRAQHDGENMVDLWFVNLEEITFLGAMPSGSSWYGTGSIAYKDDGSVAFFHVGTGELWKIDPSTKQIKRINWELNFISDLSVMNDGSLYFMSNNRREMWTSDWTKEGTVMVQTFEDSLRLFNAVTDGFVLQAKNNTMYFWDEADRSTTVLVDIRGEECMPSGVTAIQGDNGSKGLIQANGLWSIGRHPPKRLGNFWSVSYIGAIKNEVLLNGYKTTYSFKLTDGEELRPMSMPSDEFMTSSSGSALVGPFANNAHYMFMGNSILSLHNDADVSRADVVATLTDQSPVSGFSTLQQENKVLFRSVSKLWEFDAGKNELHLLVDWDEDVYVQPEESWRRDRTWDTFFFFPDGSLLMPMRKNADRGDRRRDPSYSPLEFWKIQLNAETDEYNVTETSSPPSTPPTVNPTLDVEPTSTAPPIAGEPKLDESSSSMVPLVVVRLGTAMLVVLLGM